MWLFYRDDYVLIQSPENMPYIMIYIIREIFSDLYGDMRCGPCRPALRGDLGPGLHLRLRDDGHSPDDVGAVGDLLLGAQPLLQRPLVL